MTDDQVRLAAANLLLQRGVRFTHDASFFTRLFRRNRIHIKPLYAGTIAAYSVIMLREGLEKATKKQCMEKIESIAMIIAIAVLNDEQKIETHAEKLAKKLSWKIPAAQMIQIFMHLLNISNAMDFTIITGYLSALTNQMLTAKTGQPAKGS